MKLSRNAKAIAVLVAAVGMTGCDSKDESPAPAAGPVPVDVKPECDMKTLRGCTDQQKAALRLSGTSLDASTVKPVYKVRPVGNSDKRE